jgi:DNA adenine methylase
MSETVESQRIYQAKPFLKWAGGKSQLLAQFRRHYPPELDAGTIHRYVEPFLGGGAVFVDIAQSYDIAEAHLFDINAELILTYQVVQREPRRLIEALVDHRRHYIAQDGVSRSDYFYAVRAHYNAQRPVIDFAVFSDAWISRAADMIFLNKTCFNGLFRVNASGGFNVPFGRYVNPEIFDEQNILRVSELLQRAKLYVGGFETCAPFVSDDAFVYFDPPYRPISKTASFTSYARDRFDDSDQRTLARFYARMATETHAKLMLSNSDPKGLAPDDTFFDDLYAPFHIYGVSASRMINSVAEGRGKISEILVTNYEQAGDDRE